jgi:8-oxo-dGTP diphosphatase
MYERSQPTTGAATPIAIAVVEYDERFLIGVRPAGGVLAGQWEFPGGKVRPGETWAQCAARECREESGIEVEVVALYTECEHAYDFGLLHLQFFHCRPLDPAQQPRSPFRWVVRRELSEYQFPAANGQILKRLIGCGSSAKPERGNPLS